MLGKFISKGQREETRLYTLSHTEVLGQVLPDTQWACGEWRDPPSCCSSFLKGKHESKPDRLGLGDQLFPGVVWENQWPSIYGKLHPFLPGKRSHQSHGKLRSSGAASSSSRRSHSTIPAGLWWGPFQGSSQGHLRYSCPGHCTRGVAACFGKHQPL